MDEWIVTFEQENMPRIYTFKKEIDAIEKFNNLIKQNYFENGFPYKIYISKAKKTHYYRKEEI